MKEDLLNQPTTKRMIEVGDVIELALEPFGDIKPYIVRGIKFRTQGEYSANNSYYFALRKVEDKDLKSIKVKEVIDQKVQYKFEPKDWNEI